MGRDRYWLPALGWITFAAVTGALALVLVWVPSEATMGAVQRVFYFHVAAAWVGFLAFAVTCLASIMYLWRRDPVWDWVAGSSAEVGVLFTTIVLVTGPIWARPIWLTWWTWDPRLTTTLVLWFLYLAYLTLRGAADAGQARLAAIFGIVAFADVPLVWLSARYWRSIHPVLVSRAGFNMEPSMVVALLASLAAFTLLFAYLTVQRYRLERLRAAAGRLRERLAGR